MITAFQIAIEGAGWYIGSGWHYLLFAAALLFLILKRDDKENRKWLVGYTLLFAAVYICPLTARIIMKYCIGGFCLLENVLDSANVRDFSLCGSERMYSRKEKRFRLYVHLC